MSQIAAAAANQEHPEDGRGLNTIDNIKNHYYPLDKDFERTRYLQDYTSERNGFDPQSHDPTWEQTDEQVAMQLAIEASLRDAKATRNERDLKRYARGQRFSLDVLELLINQIQYGNFEIGGDPVTRERVIDYLLSACNQDVQLAEVHTGLVNIMSKHAHCEEFYSDVTKGVYRIL